MRVLLIKPPWAGLTTGTANIPVGLTYLAGAIRDIADEVAILNADYFHGRLERVEYVFLEDMNIDAKIELKRPFELIEKTLIAFKPDVVGVSIMTPEYENAGMTIDMVRKLLPQTIIVIGGMHITLLPDEALKELKADYAVCGEGEKSFRELLIALKNNENTINIPGIWSYIDDNIVSPSCPSELLNISEIPMPDFDCLLNPDNQKINYGMIFTSRGCPANCSFCATRKIWQGKVRTISNERIIKEVLRLRDKYETEYIRFVDDTFTTDRKKIIDLCNELMNIGGFFWSADTQARFLDKELLEIMLRGRCIQINIGVESGSEKIYKEIHKPGILKNTIEIIKSADAIGLSVVAYFIIGFPGEESEDLEETYKLIKNLPALPIVSIATPYPGTEMYEKAKEYLSEETLKNYSELHHHSEKNINMTKLSNSEWKIIKQEFHNLVKEKTFEYDIAKRHYKAKVLSKNMRDNISEY